MVTDNLAMHASDTGLILIVTLQFCSAWIGSSSAISDLIYLFSGFDADSGLSKVGLQRHCHPPVAFLEVCPQ
jgi:hypothetical protein